MKPRGAVDTLGVDGAPAGLLAPATLELTGCNQTLATVGPSHMTLIQDSCKRMAKIRHQKTSENTKNFTASTANEITHSTI